MAAEPWEGCYGLSSDVFVCPFFSRNCLILCPNWRVRSSDCCFCVYLGILWRFRGVIRADASRLCWVVLVVVFHAGLRQPWRASIFRVLLASVAPSLTVEEDSKGLQSFWIKELFVNYKYIIVFTGYFPYYKLCCRQRQSNNSFIGYDLFLPLNWYVYIV